MEQILEYSFRITPGIILILSLYLLLHKESTILKIILFIFGFVLMRDAMTPIQFWNFGVTNNIVWLRFIDDAIILLFLAVVSLVLALFINFVNPQLAQSVTWFANKGKSVSMLIGISMGVIAALPFVAPYFFTDIKLRGGEVKVSLLFPLLLLAIFGNFLEELLFRGYMQEYLKTRYTTVKTIFISGLFFAFGHVFLAITVTNLGALVIIFTLWEGLLCAFIYHRYGLIPATFTHGIAIFILSSGLV